MLPLVLLSILSVIGVNSYQCSNNISCLEKERSCERIDGFCSCCPIENGICCNDGLHCCSQNERCLSNGNCLTSTNETSFGFPLRFENAKLKSTICPDGNICENDQTCCELSSGQYACCPHPGAVCCSDHIHCCPKDHKCDLEHGHCKRDVVKLNTIECPDGETACPDSCTCCQLESGGYGCCPLESAVCCSDHIHCCPNGKVCDIEKNRCTSPTSIVPLSKKVPAFKTKQSFTFDWNIFSKEICFCLELINLKSVNSSNDRLCPDAATLCPSASTCCITSDGTWGCCPIENAVCCSDHIHCCPEHYKCDLHIFKCDHVLFESIPMKKKEKAKKKISLKVNISLKSSLSISTIICPDGNVCPDETTCCSFSNGTYGCCPYEDGICCSDKIHCCGNGYSCGDSGDRCIRHFDQTFSSSKEKSMKKLLIKEDEICPDGKTKCSNNSTCCPNSNSNEISYSCCPYSKGICCGSNGSVCCPNNYDCNEDQLSCSLRDSIVLRKLLSTTDYEQCQSSDVFCSLDQTCCNTHDTSDEPFACCPYSNAQCCSDGIHCCPSGTNCDHDTGECSANLI